MTRRRFVYGLTMVFLYVTITLTVVPLYFLRLGVHDPRLDLVSMVDGSAHKPYAYRILVPSIVRGVVAAGAALAPDEASTTGNPVSKLGARVLRDIGAPSDAMAHSYEYGVFFIIVFLCLLGFGVSLRGLTRLVYPNYPRFLADLAPVVGISVIPLIFFRYANIVYDPMTLLLFTLCVYLIVKRSHVVYLFAFPLAVLNKETAILLPLILLLQEAGQSTTRKLIALTAYQLGVYAGIKYYLMHLLRGNPGLPVEHHLLHNVMLFREFAMYAKTLSVVVPLAILVAYRWTAKPVFLRRSLVLTLIPIFILHLFFGMVGELRAFYELYPFVFLLVIPTVFETFGMSGERGLST